MNESAAREGLPARLREMAEGSGGVSKLAREAGMSEAVLRKWIRGDESEPRYSDLMALVGASGYSLWWLMTGQGPRRGEAPPPAGQEGATAYGAALNPELLQLVVETIESVLTEQGVTLSPPKKAGLVRAIYELHVALPVAAREVSRPLVLQLARLAI